MGKKGTFRKWYDSNFEISESRKEKFKKDSAFLTALTNTINKSRLPISWNALYKLFKESDKNYGKNPGQ